MKRFIMLLNSLICLPLIFSVMFLSVQTANVAASDVVPINWSAFTAGNPTDTAALRWKDIMRNANKYAVTNWYNTTKNFDAQNGTYLDFGGTGESNIRPSASEAFSLAVAIKTGIYDPTYTGVSLTDATTITVKLIKSLAYRHLVNTTGGWGNAWQSALWSAYAGFAGWLMWDNLSTTDREYVRKMVEYECNRFNSATPPYGNDTTSDSKGEENSWDSMIMQLATAMMPAHPNYYTWMDKCLNYMISSYARQSDDSSNTTVINGKQVKDWLGGWNVREDGLMFNHSIMHPDYIATVSQIANAALVYTMAQKSTPMAAFFNCDLEYKCLSDRVFNTADGWNSPGGTIFKDGSYDIYYPNGNDWGTSRRVHFALVDCQASVFVMDAGAQHTGAYWEAYHAQRVLDMQNRNSDGHCYVDSNEDTYSGREEWVAVHAAMGYLSRWIVHSGKFSKTNQLYSSDEIIINDDNLAVITYSGTWTDNNNATGRINGDEHYTNVTNNYAQFTFTGTEVKWIGAKFTNRGQADIYIDDVFQTTVDEYASSQQNQLELYSKTGLASGSHRIKVVCKGIKNSSSTGYYIDVDAFKYRTGTGAGNTVSFLGTDTTTQGSWKPVYGADGYDIRRSSASLPSYVTISYPDGADYTWSSSTTDLRALQKPNPATDRIAACRFSGASEIIDLTVNGGTSKNVEIYLLDWDNQSRGMTVEAIDGTTGTTVNTQTISAFNNGKYLKYSVKGHIKFKFTRTAGPNAVFSGVFFN